jgi:NADH-quinone oxidoreductase subunit C
VNASVEQLRAQFGEDIEDAHESCGDTYVYVKSERAYEILKWLKETPGQTYNYLVDVTAVEYRDPEPPLEAVYELYSLERNVAFRVKVRIAKDGDLEIDSVVTIWNGANWLEREVFDMFGIKFRNHPDLRRILMWETYDEGFPLRKDFPLRGRLSRSEQVRRALKGNPEAQYSLEEIDIAKSNTDIPDDMRQRILKGQRGNIPDVNEGANGG